MSEINVSAAYRFPEVGRCIYCGSDEPPLSDEHIVPFALGGNLILPNASCKKCANETHAYEGKTAGTTLRNIRLRYGFPTRRKKQRETHVEIGTIDSRGRACRKKIPVSEYPVGSMLPHFGRAGFYVNAPPFLDILEHTAMVYSTDDLNEFARKHKWDGRVSFRHLPIEFAKTIIKMCYAHSVSVFGYGKYDPICVPYIIGKDSNVSYVFGQVGKNEPSKGASPVWDINLSVTVLINDALLAATCSLLPGMGTPIYEVVLGHFRGGEQIACLQNEITAQRLVIQQQMPIK